MSNSPESKEVTYSSILEEHDVFQSQRETRLKLLREISRKALNDQRGPNGTIAHISRAPLTTVDIPVLGNMLLKIGDVDTLNLILHSPGGDGTVVEKFVALCRTQCKRFRVIVPNEAKSAATLIALGADEIVMGAPSELGPVDAQIPSIINGVRTYISAQSFIDTRDELLKMHKEAVANGEDTAGILQMIASLNQPFIAECERLMDFGRDVTRQFLERYMFKRVTDQKAKIDKVVDTLSSVARFKVHGRIIDGNTARRELNLKVKLCGQNDALWKKVWEYYTRTDIALGSIASAKIFETEHELLLARPQSTGA